MAALDKTYVTKTQLLEAIKWASEIGVVTLENGHKFKPLDWISAYNDIDNLPDNSIYVLWNTPIWFDRWLWLNCPLDFVKDRIKEVYDRESLIDFEEWKYELMPENKKYTFLQCPEGDWKSILNFVKRYRPHKIMRKMSARFIISAYDSQNPQIAYCYDKQTDTWNEVFGMLPCYDDYMWGNYHKRTPSKKAIIRQLRKWRFPKGTIIKLENTNYMYDFKILVK